MTSSLPLNDDRPESSAKLSVLPNGRFRLKVAHTEDGPLDILVRLDGKRWAILPTSTVVGDIYCRDIVCSVPPHDSATEMMVECLDARSGRQILAQRVSFASPLENHHGLLASDVYDPSSNALFSVPWLEFDGANLTVSGAHLPPHGDPGLLSVAFEEGVVGDFEYPLPSPDFGAHYWYWPNAHMSGFRVRINLPASAASADAFSFRFVTGAAAPDGDSEAAEGSSAGAWAGRNRIWIPSDLRACLDYPSDEDQLARVQTWSNQRTVTFTGYNAFKGFESLADRYGLTQRDGMKVLDWGCGHGRVARHFIQNWPQAHITGVDIDRENIQWCKDHLTKGEFHAASLWPPLDLPSRSFDMVVGLSVMTHLTAEAQAAWIAEIHRLLKPGGLAFITLGGDGATAFASIHHSPDWWLNWLETGFNDEQPDTALAGKLDDKAYYRITHQTAQHARAAWCRIMTVVDIQPQAFGYQDVAILRA